MYDPSNSGTAQSQIRGNNQITGAGAIEGDREENVISGKSETGKGESKEILYIFKEART